MHEFYLESQIQLPILESGQYYIYVLQNAPDNHIKIGRTHDLAQRLQSLSGSNGGGNHIVRCFYTEPTYLYSLEHLGHNHFHYARIPNTEWFAGDKVSLEEVVTYYDELLDSPSYEKANELRHCYPKGALS